MQELLKFICRAPGCGKKFCSQKRLEIHIKSKHPELFTLLSSPDSTDLNFSKNPIENLINAQKVKTKSNLLQPIKKKSNLENKVENDIPMKVNNNNCLNINIPFENSKANNKNKNNLIINNEITDELIFSGENKIYEDYTEITNLDLSKKNINIFQTKKNIPFEYFTGIENLNLSFNNIINADDIKFFKNIKILILNNNKIKDISFCENLRYLEKLIANSNEISNIENLIKCNKLKILDISNNKIDNIIKTLNTFNRLKSLEELKIKDNPFIINLFAYKHYFIYKYQNLLKIENEEINEIDKDISGRFIRENIAMYDNLKELNNNNLENSEEIDINDKDQDNNNIIYKIGNTIISKEMHIPYKSKSKNNQQIEKKNNIDNNNIEEIKKENIKLKEVIDEQKKEIDTLKLEIENKNLILKDYESIVDQYKLKYGDINNNGSEYNNNIIIEGKNKNRDKIELEHLKRDLEMWKKEYFDLLYKKMKNEENNNIEIFNDEILNINKKNKNKNDSEGNNINIDIKKIERPKTAFQRYDNPLKEYEQIYKEISIMKSRNVFSDVLEEDTDEEEENEDNDEIKKKNDDNIKEYLNKNKNIIKNENNKNDENNSSKILKPLIIKNKKNNLIIKNTLP